MSDPNDKRPIDRVRDSALSMEVGGLADGGVSVMFDMGNSLYVVKGRAVYAAQLADQVGPERANVAVPNSQQQVIDTNDLSLHQKYDRCCSRNRLFER